MTMTQDHEHDQDDERLNALLHSVDADAAPPDPGLLQSLRERAAKEFALAANAQSVTPPGGDTSSPLPESMIRTPRRTSMITLILRGSLALSAAVGLLAVLMNPFVTPSVSGAPFSAILQELRGASTLQFQLKKTGDSQASEILV